MTVEIERYAVKTGDLGPHELIVRTHTTLISPGTELARLQGKLMFDSDVPPPFPKLDIGYANIGTVIETGAEAGFNAGDRVYTMSNHASIARVDARNSLCIPVPEGLSD